MSEEIKETVETEELETQEEVKETEESAIDKIKNKVKQFFSNDDTQEEVSDIPEFFSAATKELGWTDEEIQEFAANYTEDELDEMMPFLLGEDTEESDETSDTSEKKPKEEKVENSQEDERVQKLLDRIEKLEKAQEESQSEAEQMETVDMVNRASQMFDNLSDEFEIFGKTDDLPRFPDGRFIPSSPQMKARNEVWEKAYDLTKRGLDFDDAISLVLDAYKGKNLGKQVQRKMIKDLKANEKRLSGKRTSHESGGKELTGPEIVKQMLDKRT